MDERKHVEGVILPPLWQGVAIIILSIELLFQDLALKAG